MIYIKNGIDCCGCGACMQACPVQCIVMRADAEGFLYPTADAGTCINCNRCEKVCPMLNSPLEDHTKIPSAYAASNNREATRLQSSSGGVFTLLAEEILRRGGVVFGAAMGRGCRTVRHVGVETVEGLAALRGSKYLQSEIGNTYTQAKTLLEAGRQVLYTGTPCQIEGLKSYLGREYESLYTQDVVCHGVPSPKVWDNYVSYQENLTGATARSVSFRHKKYGWKKYSILFEFSNNAVYEQIFPKDLFMQAFLQNACLRPSCASCHFKKLNRASDITLADFWGIQNVLPQMDDDKGTSLVMIHSAKGEKLWQTVVSQVTAVNTDVHRSLAANPAMTQSAKPHRNRREFLSGIESQPFDRLVRQYAKPRYSLRNLIIAILKKLGLLDTIKNICRK